VREKLRKRNPTIIDVAHVAGVSIATVSRALNDGVVSSRAQRKIMAAVQELGYRQNTLARGLVTGRSGVIGVLVPDVVGPLYAQMLRGVEDVLEPLGLHFLMVTDNREVDQEKTAIELLLARSVDALIIIGSKLEDETLDGLVGNDLPVVLVQREKPGPTTHAALHLDNHAGVTQALEYFFQRGHRRIAHLSGIRRDGIERLASYHRILHAHGLEPRIYEAHSTEEGGFEAGLELLKHQDITAVFCSNDRIALGLYHALKIRGLRAPEDVSVIGFDALPMGAYLDPPLTSVYQPGRDMGRAAAETVLAALQGKETSRAITVEPTLVERSSVTKPKGGAVSVI
jgi:LacI family transcriptional regulator